MILSHLKHNLFTWNNIFEVMNYKTNYMGADAFLNVSLT